MTRAGKRSWLAALLSLLLLVTMVAPALAQPPALTSEDAIRFLVEHSIVQGDEQGNLNLDKTITRAELAKVVVVAKGGADLVPILAPLVSFADSKGHWGAGYIEAAARMGLVRGRDANTFDPNAPITYAEALTILLRMVDQEPLVWSPAAVMQRAAQLGIIQGSSLELIANLPAPRGAVFESLTRTMVQVPLADGSTLAKQLDADPPALTVSAPASTAADKVTVAGTATGAYAVTVNGTAATLVDGKFTAEVSLNPGANTITVVAYDVAGNQTTQTVTVVRGGDVAAISVSGPTSVKAGESVTLTLRPTDAQGNVLPGRVLTATVSDGMGTMDTATGRFTAGTKAGRATITFTASTGVTETYEIDVLGLAAEAAGLRIVRPTPVLTVGRQGTIEVEILNEDGERVTYDQGRVVAISITDDEDEVIAVSTAVTNNGVATFYVTPTVSGRAIAVVSATGLAGDEATIDIATSTRVVLIADPASGVADGSTPILIRAVLQDANGQPVVNSTGSDITLLLSSSSDSSSLDSRTVVIRRGHSSSAGMDANLIPGVESETVRITGEIVSDHNYYVVSATVELKKPVVGSAAKLEILGVRGSQVPSASNRIALVLEVVDNNGNLVSSGSYAFQVEVRTSNSFEPVIDGLPEGVTLTLGDTNEVPVKGVPGAVVARTTGGRATLYLTYDKSGEVYLKPVGVQRTDEAVDSDGEVGPANSATGLGSSETVIRFGGSPAGARAVIDLPGLNLKEQDIGLMRADGSARATVRVYVVDDKGAWIPGEEGEITIKRVSSTNPNGPSTRLTGSNSSEATAKVKNGMAEFTVVSTSNEGVDTWEVKASRGAATGEIQIITSKQRPDMPVITSASGNNSAEPNRVTDEDTALEIQFEAYPKDTYGVVKVYRSGSNTPIYISGVLDLYNHPYVEVPKDNLPKSDRYALVVSNGYGDSVKSLLWPLATTERVVKEETLKIDITSVTYDAKTGVLTANTGSGLTSSGVIDSSRLYLVTADGSHEVPLIGVTCTPSNRKFTCDLGGFGLTPEEFPGGAFLKAEHGWYYRTTGETAAEDENLSNNIVTPMADVTRAAIRFLANGSATLYIYGSNLNEGSIYLRHIELDGTPLATDNKRISASNPREVSISVPSSIAQNLAGPTATVDLNLGWLVSGSNHSPEQLNVKVYGMADISRIEYSGGYLIITGAGMKDATVDPTLLRIVNRQGQVVVNLGESGKQATVVDQTASQVKIQLHPDHVTALQASGMNGNVYVTSVETTPTSSWFTSENGWLCIELPSLYYRLRW